MRLRQRSRSLAAALRRLISAERPDGAHSDAHYSALYRHDSSFRVLSVKNGE